MHPKEIFKRVAYQLLPKEHGLNRISILKGPAKGTRMLIDIRLGGSYFLGNYDKWIFDEIALEKILKPGMVAWDCGAFYGYYAAIFRKLVGASGCVDVFEG